jgi:hypothetical protein
MRRALGLVLLLASGVGLYHEFHAATDFPTDDPIRVVDASLIQRLRAQPGLHLALAPDYEMAVELPFEDDPANRARFGTSIDMREAVSRRSIHIQRKEGRLAIHADDHNPRAGWEMWLRHATVDVPVVPLGAGVVLGFLIALLPLPCVRGAKGPS